MSLAIRASCSLAVPVMAMIMQNDLYAVSLVDVGRPLVPLTYDMTFTNFRWSSRFHVRFSVDEAIQLASRVGGFTPLAINGSELSSDLKSKQCTLARLTSKTPSFP